MCVCVSLDMRTRLLRFHSVAPTRCWEREPFKPMRRNRLGEVWVRMRADEWIACGRVLGKPAPPDCQCVPRARL